MKEMKSTKKVSLSNILFCFALLLFLARITNVLTINIIDGESMVPTYHEGEIVIGSNVEVMRGNIRYQDVITAKSPSGTPVIKRVIGIPGDVISLSENGVIYRNGTFLEEPYLNEKVEESTPAIRAVYELKEDEYFICGDNRNHSLDSRSYGPVSVKNIKSKVFFRLFKKEGN